jgi:hypothetical protein
MKNQAALTQAIDAIRAASSGQPLVERLGILESDPTQQAESRRRAASGSRAVRELRSTTAIRETLADTFSDTLADLQEMSGAGSFERALSRRSDAFWRFFGADTSVSERTLRDWRGTASERGNEAVVNKIDELIQLQRDIRDLDRRSKSPRPAVPVPES